MRVNFEANDALSELIERLQEDCGDATKKQVIIGALTFLEWAVKVQRRGLTVAAFDVEGGEPQQVFHSGFLQPLPDRKRPTKRALAAAG